MPVPLHIEAQDRAPIDHPSSQEEGALALSADVEGGRCAFGRTDIERRARLLDRALWDWMQQSGRPVALTSAALPPCEGLPPIDSVVAPELGWLIGLRHPPDLLRLAPVDGGALSAQPVGEDGRWWLVSGRGEGAFVAMHGQDPPTRIALRFDPDLPPVGLTHSAPLNGALSIELGVREAPTPLGVALSASAVASTRVDGRWLVIVGEAPGETAAAIRRGEDPPEILRIETAAAIPPSDRDLVVGVGKKRRFHLDAAPDSAWIANPDAVLLETRGTTIVLRGLSPGRTHLVVRQGADLFLVPVAVGR